MSTPPPRSSAARSTLRRDIWCALAILLLAGLIRAPRMRQSLWLDEMTTLADYVIQPWSKILAPGAGQYVPNNHVLHSVLAKLVYTGLAGGRGPIEDGHAPIEVVVRLPALAAGMLLPLALAWPLRRSYPLAALALAVIAALHPWLVDLGAEARGYTLMLLLGVVATNLLPAAVPNVRRMVGYALAVAAAVYTVPLALLILPAHAVAVAATQRGAWKRWVVGVALAILIDTALYLPMVGGIVAYYRHPYPAVDYRYFLDSLPRHALAGERLPRQHIDPALPIGHDHAPDPTGSAVFWALPVLVVILGTALAWPRYPVARPLLATLGVTSLLGVVLPLAIPGATEVRFVTWAAPWFCVAVVLMLAAIADVQPTKFGRTLAAVTLAILVGLMVWWDAHLLHNQPVREALALANRLAPRNEPVVIAYIGAMETTLLYSSLAPDRTVLPAVDADDFEGAEAEGQRETGRLPWVVILFEQMARDRAPIDPDTARLWHTLTTRYRLVARLDGRVTPVAIYAPREALATKPAVAALR